MDMGFAPTWLRQMRPPPLLHVTTLTTEHMYALPTMLISLPISCFYAEFIIQIPGKCRLRNFYLVTLLKISTDKVTTVKYIFTCI